MVRLFALSLLLIILPFLARVADAEEEVTRSEVRCTSDKLILKKEAEIELEMIGDVVVQIGNARMTTDFCIIRNLDRSCSIKGEFTVSPTINETSDADQPEDAH